MRRILVTGEFRAHHVAARSAELRRLHVADGPIGELCSEQDIQQGGQAEEPGEPFDCRTTIELGRRYLSVNLPFAEVNADRDQEESQEENGRKNKEDDNPDIRIVVAAAEM